MTIFNVLVVTYNGEASITRLINHLLKAGRNYQLNIVVVDNDSHDATVALLKKFHLNNLNIISNDMNYGIARAFNQGMEYFYNLNAPWVLILDQDSYVAENFFSVYEKVFTALTKEPCDLVAAICSNPASEKANAIPHQPYQWNGSAFYNNPNNTKVMCGLPVVASSISSGTFYKTEVVINLGGFREDYFIDFVDHEFHLKLLTKGWVMLWEQKANIEHNLGLQQHNAVDNWIEHSPYRYYYIARNMANGLFCYGGFKGLYTFLKSIPAHLLKVFRYSDIPWSITGNIIRGLLDAGFGKMGKK